MANLNFSPEEIIEISKEPDFQTKYVDFDINPEFLAILKQRIDQTPGEDIIELFDQVKTLFNSNKFDQSHLVNPEKNIFDTVIKREIMAYKMKYIIHKKQEILKSEY